jgi:multidrug efflux pump subunit AcrA (membrane-fusion protein)
MVIGPDNRAHQTTVKTGIRQGDKVQIVEGIEEGQRVISSGAYALPDKTKVTIEAAAEPAEKPAAGDDGKEDKKDEK